MKKVTNTHEVANDNLEVAADASEIQKPVPPVKPILVSDKLTALQAELLEKQTLVASGTVAPGTEQFTDIMLQMFNLGNGIKTEKAEIEKVLREADIAKKRNERLGLIDAMLEAHLSYEAVRLDANATMETKNIAYAAYKEARNPIDNEMLIRIPSGIASKKAVDGLAPKTDGGEKGKAIISYFLEQRAVGVTDTNIKKDLVASGHAVGTVGAVILQWQRANGEK